MTSLFFPFLRLMQAVGRHSNEAGVTANHGRCNSELRHHGPAGESNSGEKGR